MGARCCSPASKWVEQARPVRGRTGASAGCRCSPGLAATPALTCGNHGVDTNSPPPLKRGALAPPPPLDLCLLLSPRATERTAGRPPPSTPHHLHPLPPAPPRCGRSSPASSSASGWPPSWPQRCPRSAPLSALDPSACRGEGGGGRTAERSINGEGPSTFDGGDFCSLDRGEGGEGEPGVQPNPRSAAPQGRAGASRGMAHTPMQPQQHTRAYHDRKLVLSTSW